MHSEGPAKVDCYSIIFTSFQSNTNVMHSSDFENHAQYASTEEIANLAGVKEGHMPSRSSTRKCACCKFRDNPRVKCEKIKAGVDVYQRGASNAALGTSAYKGYTTAKLLVNYCQKGNPVLKHLKLVRWQFEKILPDYIFGPSSCALFLSLRYHLLHEDYLKRRTSMMKGTFKLRVLLLLIDMDDSNTPVAEITQFCINNDLTLVLVWSSEECARYLETYKSYEKKGLDDIKHRVADSHLAQVSDFLTVIKSINKTDVVTLISNFKSLKAIANASLEELALCPGLGPKKVRNLYEAFHGDIFTSTKLRK